MHFRLIINKKDAKYFGGVMTEAFLLISKSKNHEPIKKKKHQNFLHKV